MQNNKLGTFGGVFTPSLLTILGVIMYLRFGWVVGNVGLIGTLMIVTLSTSITFLTSLSIASIATNSKVKAGGAYYMISRSLGVEIGGALGIPLYLAQTFSVALYVMGFSESLVAVFPVLNFKVVGVITTLLLGVLALFSTKATIRAQYFILSIIGLSLISLVLGKPIENSEIEMWGVPEHMSVGFWQVFAVFFPAVTGIMTGVNMSGDLKNPSRSIPLGTFLAVAIGYLIYMGLPLILAGRADAATLVEDPLIMRKIAFWGGAILLGVWGASLSSAVGSLLGAPRVLQALTRDNVVPRKMSVLANGYGPENIPRGGTILTIAITLVSVILGDLDAIAPVLTMFFLATYGILNVTAGIERFLKSPSFRPKFKVHWIFSLVGAVGCIAVMFLIHAVATILSVVFILAVLIWLRRRRLKTTWGDVRSGMLLQVVRYALLQLKPHNDPKSWRPNILVFSGAPIKRWHLIDFANGLAQEKGLFTVATILPEAKVSQEKIYQYEKQIKEYLIEKNIRSLVRVVRAQNPFVGAQYLSNAYGLGPLVPNTILLGDTTDASHHEPYSDMINHFYQSRKNVIILRDEEPVPNRSNLNVDIWWGGLKGNGGLMMVLGYMMQNSPHWQQVNITIKMVVTSQKAALEAEKNLDKLLSSIRVDFKKKILVSEKGDFFNLLSNDSQATDLVMLGLKKPDAGFSGYFNDLKRKTASIPRKLFVVASHDIAFKEILS
ncbi:APC family permease [Marinilabilia rubra]|uniref:Na-K-Cl cotransporter n=1 Tax=Marinilabilia rubra TaxID=2162893 RepID=A0A2U2BDJ8_9BACT|nr:Na-K-Cl cotransporter [Marinilabilia rubra]PWE01142.1 Na-K-Cl cotransporter [Marinilabilia rubra]